MGHPSPRSLRLRGVGRWAALPWWLLKNGIRSSCGTSDPLFLNPAREYLKKSDASSRAAANYPWRPDPDGTGREREYGSFGARTPPTWGRWRQTLLDAGFDVPLFACNPTDDLKNGYRSDLFPVVNFGADPVRQFPGVARHPAEGAAHVRRILSRLVRHLGRAASSRQHHQLFA